ncbi:MAG: serine hydrolase [Planctomycetes bacterium]|nr:serine hydrolase [Planctomycetota bacterium]MCB9871824.1 serine hydrolase [Planctomycetota bacterium]
MRTQLLYSVFLVLVAITQTLGAQGERDWDDPTEALWRFDLTPAQVTAELQATNGRLVDIEVTETSPLKLAVATVANTGRFKQDSWWYVDLTAAAVQTYLTNNNARLIDIEVYEVGGQVRYAAVMVRNTTGAQWWWLNDQSLASIKSQASSLRARVMDIEEYTIGTRTTYDAVLIDNTGQHARTWWLYTDVDQTALPGLLNLHGARFTDLERTQAGKYHAILHQSTGERSWYYFGIDAFNIDRLLRRNGARIVDVDMTHSVLGTKLYHVVMMNRSNPLETAVGDVLRNNIATADFGFYFKQIGGAELATMEVDTVIEPASLLKTLHHVHAMQQVRLGKEKLDTVHYSFFDASEGCPTGKGAWVNESYRETLRKMMQESSNTRTRWVTDRFGIPALHQTAAALGMKNTAINHQIGCNSTPNTMTLRDVSALHESVANGYLGPVREQFYDIMLHEGGPADYPGWGTTPLSSSVVDVEAQRVGLSAGQLDAFRALLRFVYKPGGYFLVNGTFITVGGWFRIPRYENGVLTAREYTVGCFISGAETRATAEQVIGQVATELVRLEIRAAMTTMRNFTPGSVQPYGSGCLGSAGTPAYTAEGVAAISQSVRLQLQGAPATAPVLLVVGISDRAWGSLTLPLSLDPFGARGCVALCDHALPIGAVADSSGGLALAAPVPNDPRLFRATVYTQIWVVDPLANAGGFTTSNGIRVTIGG